MNKKEIKGGVYLVIDPSVEFNTLKRNLERALQGGVSVVQVWNHWPEAADRKRMAEEICGIAHSYAVPVLINEDRDLLCALSCLDGIHFDDIPEDLEGLKKQVSRPFLCGITCSNNLNTVYWANEHQLDYLSFCAMFPSSSAGTCEIVMPENVRKAREITTMPLFVSGGISADKVPELKRIIPFDGIAAISGIMNSHDPQQKVSDYLNALTT